MFDLPRNEAHDKPRIDGSAPGYLEPAPHPRCPLSAPTRLPCRNRHHFTRGGARTSVGSLSCSFLLSGAEFEEQCEEYGWQTGSHRQPTVTVRSRSPPRSPASTTSTTAAVRTEPARSSGGQVRRGRRGGDGSESDRLPFPGPHQSRPLPRDLRTRTPGRRRRPGRLTGSSAFASLPARYTGSKTWTRTLVRHVPAR